MRVKRVREAPLTLTGEVVRSHSGLYLLYKNIFFTCSGDFNQLNLESSPSSSRGLPFKPRKVGLLAFLALAGALSASSSGAGPSLEPGS